MEISLISLSDKVKDTANMAVVCCWHSREGNAKFQFLKGQMNFVFLSVYQPPSYWDPLSWLEVKCELGQDPWVSTGRCSCPCTLWGGLGAKSAPQAWAAALNASSRKGLPLPFLPAALVSHKTSFLRKTKYKHLRIILRTRCLFTF